MTQLELADKFNYSDKAVSKWENGETLPSIEVLKDLADFYGIKVDDLFNEHLDVEFAQNKKTNPHKHSRTIISLLAILLVWLIGTLIFIISITYHTPRWEVAWLAFVACVPASMILAIIFNTIRGKSAMNYVYISILVRTLLATIYLMVLTFSNYQFNIWPLFLLGVPGQAIIILWSKLKKKH